MALDVKHNLAIIHQSHQFSSLHGEIERDQTRLEMRKNRNRAKHNVQEVIYITAKTGLTQLAAW